MVSSRVPFKIVASRIRCIHDKPQKFLLLKRGLEVNFARELSNLVLVSSEGGSERNVGTRVWVIEQEDAHLSGNAKKTTT